MKCSVENCNRKAITKSFCDMHYRRFRRTGNPLKVVKVLLIGLTELEKFNLKYEKKDNGCWIWTSTTRPNAKGVLYGRMGDEGAHRVSYRLNIGPIPKGIFVCHKCDTPLCVNPNHLFLGTHCDNMRDMVDKERSFKGRGEDKFVSKLTNEQAREIRKDPRSQSTIARQYGISQATVGRIKRGETY